MNLLKLELLYEEMLHQLRTVNNPLISAVRDLSFF